MATITELAKRYAEVRQARLELEKQADEIKKGEETELKKAIMAEFTAQGLKSANVEGVGKVVLKTTYHYEIRDLNMLAYQQLAMLVQAAKEGRPLSDGLILQARIHKDNLENTLTEAGITPEQVAQTFGVAREGRDDLSFTKA